jgi:hypothetical protein
VNPQAIREMILEAGLHAAHRIVRAAQESDLDQASTEIDLETGDTRWTVAVGYVREQDMVVIAGKLHQEVEVPEGIPAFLAGMIGAAQQAEDADNAQAQFMFAVPVPWLPRLGPS